MSGEAEVCRELAAYLTKAEATQVADRLAEGQPMSLAHNGIQGPRRRRVADLLAAAGLLADRDRCIAVMRAIEGAHSSTTSVSTVWTAPGALAGQSQLTSSIHHDVDRARESVICSTFNFQRSSALWQALAGAAARPEVAVRVYVDTAAADETPARWKPTTGEIARALTGAHVFRTATWEGRPVRSHAKFVAIDHQFLIVTSANFSRSAEHTNVELGLVITDRFVTQAVERQMSQLEEQLYERV